MSELSGSPGSEGYEVCDDEGQELTWIERQTSIQNRQRKEKTLRESIFKEYQELPLTLTAPEVGEVLGISRAAAYQLVRSDGFPSFKIGTRILVPKDKFLAWIDRQVEDRL